MTSAAVEVFQNVIFWPSMDGDDMWSSFFQNPNYVLRVRDVLNPSLRFSFPCYQTPL